MGLNFSTTTDQVSTPTPADASTSTPTQADPSTPTPADATTLADPSTPQNESNFSTTANMQDKSSNESLGHINFTEDYGTVNTISFLCAILSRLSYMPDNQYLGHITKIFGSSDVKGIIPEELLKDINNCIQQDGIKGILNDTAMFKLDNENKKYGLNVFNQTNDRFGKKGLQFLPWATQINKINQEERIDATTPNCNTNQEIDTNDNIVFVSIATSNYGNIYVTGDKRMPNLIVITFRGTYSLKSFGSYAKLNSAVPLFVSYYIAVHSNTKEKNEKFHEKYLKGIYKLLMDVIHILMEAILYVSQKINPTAENGSIKLLTTGHSLGGALCTMFAYIYALHLKKDKYPTLDDNIACISLGSPRCFYDETAKIFCGLTEKNKIIYLRITSYNDPVPSLPPPVTGFVHPCSSKGDESKREATNIDCFVQIANSTSTRCGKQLGLAITPNYKLPLKCVNKKRNSYLLSGSPVLKQPMGYHVQYLGISFGGALDVTKVINNEIKRNVTNDTMCRLIFYPNNQTNDINSASLVFYNLVKNRKNEKDPTEKATSMFIQKVSEDIFDSPEFFKQLLTETTPYTFVKTEEPPKTSDNIVVRNTTTKVESVSQDVNYNVDTQKITIGQLQPVEEPTPQLQPVEEPKPQLQKELLNPKLPSFVNPIPAAAAAGGGRSKKTTKRRKTTQRRKRRKTTKKRKTTQRRKTTHKKKSILQKRNA